MTFVSKTLVGSGIAAEPRQQRKQRVSHDVISPLTQLTWGLCSCNHGKPRTSGDNPELFHHFAVHEITICSRVIECLYGEGCCLPPDGGFKGGT